MSKRLFGVLAEFANPNALYHACEAVRDAGFRHWDAHTPFPVHGLEKAMGTPWSKVPWFSAAGGFSGAAGGFLLQVWVATSASPLVISGKPLLSWPAFIPVTFELGILFTCVGTLVGMLVLNLLPRPYHPLFRSERFERVTDDAFFVSIEARDSHFDATKTPQWLKELGATHIEMIEE
jgi:hypothetical protein